MAMSEEAKQVQRDYMNNWRRNNPEKVKEYNKTYWENKAKELKEQQAE